MNLFNLFILIAIASLLGCQSTSPVKTQKKYPSYEENLNNEAAALKRTIENGNLHKRIDLAFLYLKSSKQEKRKLALPILLNLKELGDKQSIAISVLAYHEMKGSFGYISLNTYKENHEKIKKLTPGFVALAKYYDDFDLMRYSYDSVKMIYDNNLYLCEQPLDERGKLVKNELTSFKVKYLLTCLNNYSFQNSKKRLLVIAEFESLFCSLKKPGKECVGDGYRMLSQNNITAERYFVVAAALRYMLKTHQHQLQKKYATKRRVLSSKPGKLVQEAFDYYNEDKYIESIRVLKKALQLKNINGFDKAFIYRMLGNLYAGTETEENKDKAISYLEKSLLNNELGRDEQWASYFLLTKLYFNTEQYGRYIKSVANYIMDNQKEYDLLPKETVASINRVLKFPINIDKNNMK